MPKFAPSHTEIEAVEFDGSKDTAVQIFEIVGRDTYNAVLLHDLRSETPRLNIGHSATGAFMSMEVGDVMVKTGDHYAWRQSLVIIVKALNRIMYYVIGNIRFIQTGRSATSGSGRSSASASSDD